MAKNLTNLDIILPNIRKLSSSMKKLEDQSHLVLVLGFEERCTGYLQLLEHAREQVVGKIQTATIIDYLPKDIKNYKYKKYIETRLKKLNIRFSYFKFDRADLSIFSSTKAELLHAIGKARYVYIDISAMSKILILFILRELYGLKIPLSVIYTEAKTYGPSKKEYKISLKKGEFGNLLRNDLLFSGVFEPVVPLEFSGMAPLNGNRTLITFLSYNKRQAIGATGNVPYQFLIPIIGVPPKQSIKWRAGAVAKINDTGLLASGQNITDIKVVSIDEDWKKINGEYRIDISTFDYKETLKVLLKIYDTYRYKYYFTIAPFGSKLQTLGASIFLLISPETQVVYTSPKDYFPNYSRGIKDVYQIDIKNSELLSMQLKHIMNPGLNELEKLSETGISVRQVKD